MPQSKGHWEKNAVVLYLCKYINTLRRRGSFSQDFEESFPDRQNYQNIGGVTFLGLKRNSHNLQCVPWGRRCQAMIGGFQNSAVARKESRVTQITRAVQEISRIEPYRSIDLGEPIENFGLTSSILKSPVIIRLNSTQLLCKKSHTMTPRLLETSFSPLSSDSDV